MTLPPVESDFDCPDALDRVLADLASRADLHQTSDRVPAIHRRARRAAAVRVAAVAGALTAVVAVAVAVGSGGLPFTRAEESIPAHHQPAPFLKVSLAYEDKLAAGLTPSRPGIPVVIRINLHGRVPQMANRTGALATSATDNTLGFKMHWSKNGYDGATPGYACVAGARLVDVDEEFLMTTYYRRPGTYTIAFDTAACDPVGPVSKSLTITVR
jgi:hypothetical protein